VQAIPLPPVIPLPTTFIVPNTQILPPLIEGPKWQPIPIYVEDIPKEIELPKTNAEVKEEKESPNKSKNKSEPKSDSTPEPIAEPIPEMAEVQTVKIPLVGLEVPLPRTEILVIASTIAGVSSVTAVAGTLLATTMFRQLQPILKPIFKTIAKKLAKARKKKPPLSFGRQRLKDRYLRKRK